MITSQTNQGQTGYENISLHEDTTLAYDVKKNKTTPQNSEVLREPTLWGV